MPNSATLVQALGAAFCAILCALSSLGGGGMMIGARTAAWAKSGGWVNPYVTDGLIAMWDGEWNAGGGIHNPNATVWKDLIGIIDLSVQEGAYFNNQFMCRDSAGMCAKSDVQLPSFVSCEIVGIFDVAKSNSTSTMIDFGGENFRVFARYGTSSPYFYSSRLYGEKRARFAAIDDGFGSFYLEYKNDTNAELNSASFNGNAVSLSDNLTINFVGNGFFCVGSNVTSRKFAGKVGSIRIYNRALIDSEKSANYAIDKARFNLQDAA